MELVGRCAACFSSAMPASDRWCVASGSTDKNAYRQRNPEDSLLYRTIAGHLETFLARQQERGREVPQFECEMRAYLSCGILACGFLRLQCESCGKDRLLPLTPWRDGTTHAIFEPLQFLEKLAALVPSPRAHLVRFHGALEYRWRKTLLV